MQRLFSERFEPMSVTNELDLVGVVDSTQRTAGDLMTARIRSCSPYSTVLEAVLIFRDIECGAVPVINGGEAIGILTDRDVALAVAEYPDLAHRSVSDIMSKGVITISPDALLDDVRSTFLEHGVGRLLVCDSEQQVLGIISWTDLPDSHNDRRSAVMAHEESGE